MNSLPGTNKQGKARLGPATTVVFESPLTMESSVGEGEVAKLQAVGFTCLRWLPKDRSFYVCVCATALGGTGTTTEYALVSLADFYAFEGKRKFQ